jgi:hypothetical protein
MITLSCGHTIKSYEEDYYDIMVKDYTREGTKAIAYKSVCSECYDDYKVHNEILETEDLAEIWIGIKE